VKVRVKRKAELFFFYLNYGKKSYFGMHFRYHGPTCSAIIYSRIKAENVAVFLKRPNT